MNPPTLPATTPEEQNFRDFFQRVYLRAVRAASWFVDDAAAWDAVQDAGLKFFRTWDRLSPEQKTERYFVKAVHHRVIEHLRRERRYVDLSEDVEQELADAGELDPPPLVIAGEALEVAALIQPIVRRFPVRMREVWMLFHDQECSYAETAKELGITEATARRHMGIAMEKVRAGVARAGYRLADTTLKGLASASGEGTPR